MGLTDYEILRTERFGSRECDERDLKICEVCKTKIDWTDDIPCRDGEMRIFCSAECFFEYYGWEKLN